MFWYSQHLKNGDPVSVVHIRTSRRYCPFQPSTSRLRQLVPYCLITIATAPAAPAPGLCPLLIAGLNDRDCVRGCL